MAEPPPPETIEVRAVLQLLADAHGIDDADLTLFPGKSKPFDFNAEDMPGFSGQFLAQQFPELDERFLGDDANPLQVVADSEVIWPPVKLELLRQAMLGESIDRDHLLPLARSIVDPEHQSDEVAHELLDRIELTNAERGHEGDPLGRSVEHNARNGFDDSDVAFFKQLRSEVQDSYFTRLFTCDADVQTATGERAISIRSELISTAPPEAFTDIVTPANWSNCPAMRSFFVSMDPVPGTRVDYPYGYAETLVETVDFSFGFLATFALMETTLRVEVTDHLQHPTYTPFLGSTYELVDSVGDRIEVDSGSLTATLNTATNETTLTVEKDVRFAEFEVSRHLLCPIWSMLSHAMTYNCLTT